MPAPLDAVIVAIDSARCSGVATYVSGRLHHYCEVSARAHGDRQLALRDAVVTARVRGLPCAMVLEVPYGGRLNAALSLTATATLWLDTWAQLGQQAGLCVELTAPEWRRQVFGKRPQQREQARRLEALLAEQIAGRDLPGRVHRIGPDAAAAVCMGQTQIRSRELFLSLARYSR